MENDKSKKSPRQQVSPAESPTKRSQRTPPAGSSRQQISPTKSPRQQRTPEIAAILKHIAMSKISPPHRQTPPAESPTKRTPLAESPTKRTLSVGQLLQLLSRKEAFKTSPQKSRDYFSSLREKENIMWDPKKEKQALISNIELALENIASQITAGQSSEEVLAKITEIKVSLKEMSEETPKIDLPASSTQAAANIGETSVQEPVAGPSTASSPWIEEVSTQQMSEEVNLEDDLPLYETEVSDIKEETAGTGPPESSSEERVPPEAPASSKVKFTIDQLLGPSTPEQSESDERSEATPPKQFKMSLPLGTHRGKSGTNIKQTLQELVIRRSMMLFPSFKDIAKKEAEKRAKKQAKKKAKQEAEKKEAEEEEKYRKALDYGLLPENEFKRLERAWHTRDRPKDCDKYAKLFPEFDSLSDFDCKDCTADLYERLVKQYELGQVQKELADKKIPVNEYERRNPFSCPYRETTKCFCSVKCTKCDMLYFMDRAYAGDVPANEMPDHLKLEIDRQNASAEDIPALINSDGSIYSKDIRTHPRYVGREHIRNAKLVSKETIDQLSEDADKLEKDVKLRLYLHNTTIEKVLECNNHHLCEGFRKNMELEGKDKIRKEEKKDEEKLEEK